MWWFLGNMFGFKVIPPKKILVFQHQDLHASGNRCTQINQFGHLHWAYKTLQSQYMVLNAPKICFYASTWNVPAVIVYIRLWALPRCVWPSQLSFVSEFILHKLMELKELLLCSTVVFSCISCIFWLSWLASLHVFMLIFEANMVCLMPFKFYLKG